MPQRDVYAEFSALRIERTGAVLRLTLDNPPMNSVTTPMHEELPRFFRRAALDPDARVIVVTGAGDRAFSAGADLDRLIREADDTALWRRQMAEQREIVCGMLECDKPIVGRINGHAIGVGATIALACDIVVMVDTAKIADTHVRVGLAAGDGGAILWPHLVGMARAKRYLLTGDSLTGREAADLGLIAEAAPREELDAVVDAWAERFVRGAPVAIATTKRALHAGLRQDAQAYMDLHLGLETLSQQTDDYREALHAFRDKREPVFKGR